MCLAQLLEGCKNTLMRQRLEFKRLCKSPLNKVTPAVGCPLSKSLLAAEIHV